MIDRIATHLLIRPEDVAPSQPDWEVLGTFNPGVVRLASETVIMVRVAERPRKLRHGWLPLPRWSEQEGVIVDWSRSDDWEMVDSRVVRSRRDGRTRLTFLSHLRIAVSRDGRKVDRISGPLFCPGSALEEFGVEDPRITPLAGRFYVTYVAVSRHGAATALASTADFQSFDRHGVIFCAENKDVVLFPRTIDGNYVALHRPVGGTPFAHPEMWIARSPDLVHWGQHEFLFAGRRDWETGRVGAGTPPIEVPGGWLQIYHGNQRPRKVGDVGSYYGGAMLLAKSNPGQVLRVCNEAILRPQQAFELQGYIGNVVFPTGVVEEDDRLLVYYGASDKYTAMVEISTADVLRALLK